MGAGESAPRGIAFNFGLTACGPMRQWLVLRRLLDAGIRPDVLLVEILPPLLNEPGRDRLSEEAWLIPAKLGALDVLRLRTYHSKPRRLWERWLPQRLAPGYTQRQRIVASVDRGWLPREQAEALECEPGLAPMDSFGWQPTKTQAVAEADRVRLTETVYRQYSHAFADFRLGDGPVRALRDTVARCRQEGIRVVLVRMPESTTFRRWSEPLEASVSGLLAELRAAGAEAVIDAREWVGDDGFWDSHHLLPRGAAEFSDRLGGELRRALRKDSDARR